LHVHVLNIIVIWQTPCNKRYVSSVISEGDTLHLHQWIVTDVFFINANTYILIKHPFVISILNCMH